MHFICQGPFTPKRLQVRFTTSANTRSQTFWSKASREYRIEFDLSVFHFLSSSINCASLFANSWAVPLTETISKPVFSSLPRGSRPSPLMPCLVDTTGIPWDMDIMFFVLTPVISPGGLIKILELLRRVMSSSYGKKPFTSMTPSASFCFNIRRSFAESSDCECHPFPGLHLILMKKSPRNEGSEKVHEKKGNSRGRLWKHKPAVPPLLIPTITGNNHSRFS